MVFHSDTLEAGTPAFELAAAQAMRDIPDAPHVAGVLSHLVAPRQVSDDGHTAYDVVLLDLPPDDSPDAVPILEERLGSAPGLEVALAGGPAFYGDVQRVSEEDLRRSEVISLPLAAIALLLVFGSLVAAGVPLAVGGAAVLVALAAIFVVASFMPMSVFVLNLATLLGLGLGVDYSLLMTSRFREELAARGGREEDVPDAVRATVATAGRAVFFSGLTVLLGLLGLVLFEFMILRSVGIAGAIVVGSCGLGGADPHARLAGDRRHPDRPIRDPSGGGRGAHGRALGGARPRGDASPGRRADPDARAAAPARRPVPPRPLQRPGRGDPAGRCPVPGLVRSPAPRVRRRRVRAARARDPDGWPGDEPRQPRRAVRLLATARADERVRRVTGLVDVDPRLTLQQYQLLYGDPKGPRDRFVQEALAATTKDDLTTFTLYTPYGPNRAEARALVADLRRDGSALAPPAGMTVLVGGGAADVDDVVSRVSADFPRTALFILVTTYAVLFMLLRSVILPLKALAMNTLSIVASFGALVWIFQDGNLSGPLGFEPLGFVETTQPVILFCVLFGLSMDYEVFLLSRMKEVWDRTGDNAEAVARGLERSGRIVSSAALIVVVVASSFAFADIVLIKALGIGVAVAVALDATVVRALLVPATMKLLGKWNWWMPARLERIVGSRLPASEAEIEAALR